MRERYICALITGAVAGLMLILTLATLVWFVALMDKLQYCTVCQIALP